MKHSQTIPELQMRMVPLRKVCRLDLRQVMPGTSDAATLPYVGMEDIESGSGRFLSWPHEADVRSNTFAFDTRHILYGKLRPYLNKVALPDRSGRCSTELLPLLPSPGVDRQYLAWLLRRPATVAVAMQAKTGSRMPRASMTQLMALTVPLPSLADQKRIVAKLDEQMVALDRAEKALVDQQAAASALTTAVLQQAFNGSESARWPQVRLGEVAASNLTQVPPNEEFAKDLPYIGMEDIESQTGRIIARSAHSDIRSNTFAFDERHVLYGKLRPYLNKVALPESGGRCSTELIPLLPAAGLDRRYLAWFLRRPETVSAAMQEKTGSRMPRASMKNIGQLHIPLPPVSHQRQVVASLERISAELTSLQQHFADQRTDLAVLRSFLLNTAFSGEI